jgi:hypothetical protein
VRWTGAGLSPDDFRWGREVVVEEVCEEGRAGMGGRGDGI